MNIDGCVGNVGTPIVKSKALASASFAMMASLALLSGCGEDPVETHMKDMTYYTAHKDLERKCYEHTIKKALKKKLPKESIDGLKSCDQTFMKSVGTQMGLSPEKQKEMIEDWMKRTE